MKRQRIVWKMNKKSQPCRSLIKPTAEDVNFCRALLNNQCPSTMIHDGLNQRRKVGFRLPPADFVYGLKHPKPDGISGVAAALRHDELLQTSCRSSKRLKINRIPDFISLNRLFPRLKLTKVNEIHQYRKTVSSDSCKPFVIKHKEINNNITFGRVTREQTSMRDLLEHKYLDKWLEEAARRRCKEMLEQRCEHVKKKSNVQRIRKRVYCH